MTFLRLLHASERRSSNFARRERVMLEGGLNRLIRRGFAARRGVVMVLWHTTGSPNSGEHRLIALSEVDTAFDEKAVKELGRAAKVPTGADIARFGENIRIAARLYLEGKSRLNAPRLREKIVRLYQLNMRAERGSDRAARRSTGADIEDIDRAIEFDRQSCRWRTLAMRLTCVAPTSGRRSWRPWRRRRGRSRRGKSRSCSAVRAWPQHRR